MVYLLFLLLIILCFTGIGWFLSSPAYKGPVSDHFDGQKFFNPRHKKTKGLKDVLKWMLTRKKGDWNTFNQNSGPKPEMTINEGIRITFVNHSTFLIQVDGVNILTDPVWSSRTSPFSWIGPKRLRVPGIRFEDLPEIHLVVVSHNHYDHLDIATLKNIYNTHRPTFVTPLGVKAFLEAKKITSVHQLDWWEKIAIGKLAVECVPAMHFSGRGTFDRDSSLWCGYILSTRSGNIYFAGDTGYNIGVFKSIGSAAGPIHLSIIPIGAYKPDWFMSPIHCSPEEAVQIHLDVKSQLSIACHYGTFALADDSQVDPLHDLSSALNKNGLSSDVFIVLQEGQPYDFKINQAGHLSSV